MIGFVVPKLGLPSSRNFQHGPAQGENGVSVTDTEDVWLRSQGRLQRYVRSCVDVDQDVEDILQTVFVRAQASAKSPDEIKNFEGWLFRIAQNTIADHFRKKTGAIKALEQIKDGLGIEESTQPCEPPPASFALAIWLRPLLDALPARYSEALALTELVGLTQEAAAQRVGISISGMKSRVQRGRIKLKEAILRCCTITLDGRRGILEFTRKESCGCQRCECDGPNTKEMKIARDQNAKP